MIWGIQSADIPEYAARLAPFLLNFAEKSHARTTAIQLVDALMARDMQAWVCGDFDAVCLTSVHPEHVEINCCAGEDRTAWQDDLEEHLAEWARFLGKARLIMIARPGWQKWARGKGYKPAHVELVRNL